MGSITVNIDGSDGKTIQGGALSPSEQMVERPSPGQTFGRDNMRKWLQLRSNNVFERNGEFQHTLQYHLGDSYKDCKKDLSNYGAIIPNQLDAAATENDFRFNNPRIDAYNGIGDRIDQVVHHPDYVVAGDYIYGTGLVKTLATMGGLKEGMAYYYLGNHVGEAGHNCPVICNYETARVLKLVEDFPGRKDYIKKLEEPSYSNNYTSSQFLTEVQGGSDVGANDLRAWQNEAGEWFIRGEKWFCSNANAELMVVSARRSMERPGTKGLSMFLIPSQKPDGTRNDFTMRRLKEKLGTRALASAEIDYHDSYAIPLGSDFNFMLERVVHHSRIALSVAVCGMTTRAYQFSLDFAKTRMAFGSNILQYPLVKENLAQIKADNLASFAGTYALISLQDKIDMQEAVSEPEKAFCRLMVNIGKSVISKRGVNNIHHCLDGIGGNGAIENMSSLPRLLRDAIIFENWEGTHNTLYVQVLRDIHKYEHDKHYISTISELIEELPEHETETISNAKNNLHKISQLLSELHNSSHEVQTLLMQGLVTAMANLYYYLCLSAEGFHAQEKQQTPVKISAAKLFLKIMDSRENTEKDKNYLTLCDEVLNL